MKKIKKIAASIMAVAAMASSMVGINASAYNTGYKWIKPLGGTAKACVDFDYGTRYNASTRKESGSILSVNVKCWAWAGGNEIVCPTYSDTTYVTYLVNPTVIGHPNETISSFKSKHQAVTSTTTGTVGFQI